MVRVEVRVLREEAQCRVWRVKRPRPRAERIDTPMERDSPTDACWTLSDGRAGNVRQARALAVAMGFTQARDVPLVPHAPWRWIAPRMGPGSAHAFGAAFHRMLEAPPPFVIGCGRQAALATRLLRARGTRTVQILDPRRPSSAWDVVVAPTHDSVRGDNVVSLIGSLHPVDDAWLAQARTACSILAPLAQPRTALLLGGPSEHVAGYDGQALARARWPPISRYLVQKCRVPPGDLAP
jgi:hypothetical protein